MERTHLVVAEEEYVADGSDDRIAVPLNVEEYWRLPSVLEGTESTHGCDAAAAVRENAIPFDIMIMRLTHHE